MHRKLSEKKALESGVAQVREWRTRQVAQDQKEAPADPQGDKKSGSGKPTYSKAVGGKDSGTGGGATQPTLGLLWSGVTHLFCSLLLGCSSR